jgi:hypothetical protein
MNTWIGSTRMLVFAGLAFAGIGAGVALAEDYDVVVTGVHEGNILARGDHVTVEAEARADLVAMGWKMNIRSQVDGDVMAIGGKVVLDGTVNGDVVVAGGDIGTKGTLNTAAVFIAGKIDLGGSINGLVLAFGGRVVSRGETLSNAKIVAGKVTGRSTVGGNLQIAAGKVDLREETVVRGKTWVATGEAELDGRYEGELHVAAREVVITGEMLGDVFIDAVEIVIEPTAIVHGNLYYRSPAEAEIHPDARIDGDVEFTRSERPLHLVGMWLALAGIVALTVIGGMILLGAVVTTLVPRMFPAAADRIALAPWRSLAIGFAVLFGVPLLTVVLKLSIVGGPLAVCLIAAYVILLPIGLLTAAYWVGRRGLRLARVAESMTFLRRLAIVAVGVCALSVIGLIPVLGVLVVLAALLFGTGALVFEARGLCHLGPA